MIERYRPKRKRALANRKRFTEENVFKLPRKDHQYLIWDEGTEAARGLAILVSPTGTKSYRVVYYYPGSSKPHYKPLGRVGEITLEEARTAARAARGTARQGEDPRAGTPTHSDIFAAAVESYIRHEQIGKNQNTSALDTKKVMLTSCADWHRRPVATIRYQEIDALLELIRDGNADKELKPRPYLANRVYSHLKDFFGWCARKKMISTSPMSDMKKPWNGATRRTRDWFKGAAADNAVRELWRTAEEIGGNEGRYLKMLLLTGKRKSALAAMRWEHIDAYWFWHAPLSQSKNKRLHPIPLPSLAQRVLHPREEKGSVFGKFDFDRLQSRIRKASGLDDFFFHGTRHLLESKLAELKIPPHIRDLLFDHAPNRGTGASYDHYEYKEDMLDALEKLAGHIERLTTAEGVARLR